MAEPEFKASLTQGSLLLATMHHNLLTPLPYYQSIEIVNRSKPLLS